MIQKSRELEQAHQYELSLLATVCNYCLTIMVQWKIFSSLLKFFSILNLQSLHFCETQCVKIYCHGVNMLALVVDLPIQRTYLRDGSMKLTHGRGKHYLTQIRVIILILSWFMLLSIVQQVENRKNIGWERNLLYQERTYEVQERGGRGCCWVFWGFLF